MASSREPYHRSWISPLRNVCHTVLEIRCTVARQRIRRGWKLAEIYLHVIMFGTKYNMYRDCTANASILVCSFKVAFDVLISKRFMASVAFESELYFCLVAILYDNWVQTMLLVTADRLMLRNSY